MTRFLRLDDVLYSEALIDQFPNQVIAGCASLNVEQRLVGRGFNPVTHMSDTVRACDAFIAAMFAGHAARWPRPLRPERANLFATAAREWRGAASSTIRSMLRCATPGSSKINHLAIRYGHPTRRKRLSFNFFFFSGNAEEKAVS